ncbi:MAG: pilus assembly protein PilB [Ectothiorhodospiraceae bacterium]|nr:pilus assembly protein PilB [Ectothiorhodospiraceae bacterium]
MIDKVGFVLLQRGVVDKETITKALAVKEKEQGNGQRSIAQILVSEFKIDHDAVYSEIAKIYAFKELDLNEGVMDERRISYIKQLLEGLTSEQKREVAEAKALPLKYDENVPEKLIIIASDPTHKTIPRIAYYFKARKYETYYVKLSQLQPHLDSLLRGENTFLEQIKDVEEEIDAVEFETAQVDEDALDKEINKSMLINFFEGCLVEGTRKGTSDVHIVPKSPRATDFRFRIDGKLQLWQCLEGPRPEAVIAVVKDRSRNVDRFERDRAQDGFIQRVIDNSVIRFRVSIIPVVGQEFHLRYESIVIRILDDRKVIKDISKIGFQKMALKWFNDAIRQPQGLVILTGPTGSGKSTTLVAALYAVVTPEVNVLTVEDPVEYVIHGARQLKIAPKLSFEQAIRAILRHDPDIVMVGEMRDKITAETAIKMANTGHLVFSTLHTNDAPSAVTRLFKMGVETFLIAYAINLVVAQRLVRRLCTNCKKEIEEVDVVEAKALGFTDEEIENETFYEPVGCSKCNSGYKGRMGIHESLHFSPEVRKIIFDSGENIDEEKIRQTAISQGMLTLRASARERVKEGGTSFHEVAAVTTA